MSKLTDFLNTLDVKVNDSQNEVISQSTRSTLIVPLLHQKAFSISGPDTHKFLQGQLTCDVDDVFSRGSALGAHCNIKGHMISLFRLLSISNEEVWIRLSEDIFESAIKSLHKYIVFSKAEINELGDNIAGIGITGPGAEALIEQWFGHCPSEDNGCIKANQGVVVRVPGNRFEIWMQTEELIALLEQKPDAAGIGSTNDWILSEIDAAIPDLRADTQEAFIPQMTNFQIFEGVSFNKGCYTGQEIVTRLQHRGQLKKPMYLAEVNSDTAPYPGMLLASENKPSSGKVVLSAPCGEDKYRVLAVIVKNTADSQPVYLADNQAVLELKELPYTLDPQLFMAKN
jgi:folate-binding protein YgfZ